MPEVVTYDGLPTSAGCAHSLRAKRPDKAFQCLRTFLEACTEPVSLPSWTFEIYKGAPQVPTEQLSSLATETLRWALLADERLSPGARLLQDHHPFRLSVEHWRLWQPTRSADSYRSNKIPSPVHDQA
ncbi:hypothetical protein QM716_22645 [Rhodococcus sp. IEGM 1409]|uniref:hypothetical protein n=1 Tax=Rhodococcus sp. IEGM 1409 TaxID=3047082 RepID=UPI0024B6E1CB|nr:hypothetical protein [Rhodococcus sp. IEGM 1409]MDI9902659.1 hypothetical protein [Rhodococcus sp. IEGM 1409]